MSRLVLLDPDAEPRFPDPDSALQDPNGLLAAGGALSPVWLLNAYHRGIFPWYSEGEPILWWSPDPRAVLYPADIRIARSLHRTLKSRRFTVTMDQAFQPVIEHCARIPRTGQSGTWITAEMRAAYLRLHQLGIAHSVETWDRDRLVGGLYGVAIGRVFFGESMFASETDASKVALVHLAGQLLRWRYEMIDCQQTTGHLLSLGATEIPRTEFLRRLRHAVGKAGHPRPWRLCWSYSEAFRNPERRRQNAESDPGDGVCHDQRTDQ